jgi:cysteine-rich repeat protein
MYTSLVAALAALIFLSPAAARGQCDQIPDCVVVWSDEFAGSAVDPAKWEFQTGDGSQFGIPGWGNNELQWYQSSNASVANGALTIQARQQAVGGKAYTSARLRSLGKADFLYGRFEMRARLPVGKGMWPAFWMLPSDTSIYGVWAASGEIDIMESTGGDQIHGTIHYGGSFPDNVYSGSVTSLPTGTADEFHVYAAEWEPTEIRWYVDGQLYGTKTNWYSSAAAYPAPFDVDFHLLLNLAVGGNFPGNPDGSTVFPQDYVIDYVRVYQQAPADPEQAAQCAAAKSKLAGKYARCTTGALFRAIRKGEAADAERLARCAAKLENGFARVELKNGASCAAGGDAATVLGDIDACVQDAATDLGGVPGPGAATASCHSGKLRDAGKYADCRFGATAKGLRRTVAPDFTRCVSKFAASWNRLEDSVSKPCATNGDLAGIQAGLDGCHGAIVAVLDGPNCGDGVVDADEECDDGNTASGDGCSSLCLLQAEYRQDFESLTAASGSALADDGWVVYGNVFNGTTGAWIYGYGTNPAPNGTGAFCSVATGQGGVPQGSRQMVVFSDYNNGDHGNGRVIESNVFRERFIGAADVGKTVELTFDAKRGDLSGVSTAQAFIKTLDPDAGYATTNVVVQNTTSIATTWHGYTIELEIDASLEGQLLQYGFSNRARNYEASGVYYDNVALLRTPTVP